MLQTAIVILNFNGLEFLKKFLDSVENNLHQDAEIVLVDNASTDGSVAWLQASKPELRRIVLDKNYGYAGGYNRALQQIEAVNYLLLNSDVEVAEGWLDPLLEIFGSNDQIAAVQPKIKAFEDPRKFEYAGASGGFLDLWGYPFCRGRIFDEIEMDVGQYDNAQKIFWATGAAFMIRAELFHKAGGFDENFFAHMEEIDLCWRLQHMGYEIWVEPKSEVYHLGGGTLQNGSALKYYLNYRNNLAMLTKNLSSKYWFALIFWKMLLDGLSALNFFIGGKAFVLWQVIKAHAAYWKKFRYWKAERRKIVKRLPDQALYQKSVVWQYFARGKKTFDAIDIS